MYNTSMYSFNLYIHIISLFFNVDYSWHTDGLRGYGLESLRATEKTISVRPNWLQELADTPTTHTLSPLKTISRTWLRDVKKQMLDQSLCSVTLRFHQGIRTRLEHVTNPDQAEYLPNPIRPPGHSQSNFRDFNSSPDTISSSFCVLFNSVPR